jgi:hypothetical protein
LNEQIGSSYQSAKFAKALIAGEYKTRKTASIVAWCLGLFPWQLNGGVVSRPEDLNVITFDSGALSGVIPFLKETLKAPDEAFKFRVWNLEDDTRRIYESEKPYDHSLYSAVLSLQARLRDSCTGGGTPVVVMSSLTVLAMALERAIMGPPTGAGKSGKGIGDEDRWGVLKRQLFTLQNAFGVDAWHMIWEAHIAKSGDDEKETLQVSGAAGKNWGVNVEQIFRLRRGMSVRPGLEQILLDTRPDTSFIAGGKNFSERLKPEEPDLTVALYKLGLKVGCWNKPKKEEPQRPA